MALSLLTHAVPGTAACKGPGWISTCSASTDGTSVQVGGTHTESGRGGSGTGKSGGSSRGGLATRPAPTPGPGSQQQDCGPGGVLCRGGYSVSSRALPQVTVSDLTSFLPAGPGFSAEPEGVGVVGMPTNFVASAPAHTQSGTLFDMPVTVHFEPVAYVFAHGDGTTTRSETGGATWAALGLPAFSATPTSHSYGARGTYSASVSVEYAASVDFGTGFRPVPGIVTANGGAQSVRVFEARTALVDRSCAEAPAGPGC